jgi:hypothetical protein
VLINFARFGVTAGHGIENKGALLCEIISLTIISNEYYCGDGHSCPGD